GGRRRLAAARSGRAGSEDSSGLGRAWRRAMTLAIPMVDIPSGVTRALGSLKAKEQPLPLESVQLRARVIDRVAEVTVEEKFGNPVQEAIEAVYVFPLSGGRAGRAVEREAVKRVAHASVA